MKPYRILIGLIASTLLGIVPLSAVTAPTSARPTAPAAQAASVSDEGHHARQLPKRHVSSTIVRKGRHHLVMKGRISPDFGHKRAYVMKKKCIKHCPWVVFRKARTDGSGRYRSPVTAPRHGADYWQVMVKKQGGYARSYSSVWKTFVS
jgi:hypothetical protein